MNQIGDDPILKNKTVTQQEWENRILHGLLGEWEMALWLLSSVYRQEMRPPLFSLRDWNDRWGVWLGEKREIALSRNLVWNHSWGSVREVLFHEMAHQLAEEVLGSPREAPHGPTFQKACRLLGANPKASGHYKTLDERISQGSSDPDDRIMLRVKKLMALAESPDRHEAEAAMAKAHALITRYNLDAVDRDKKRDFISVLVGRPNLRHFAEDYHLAHLLQDFYFVKGIWVSSYVLEKRRMGRVLEISGTIPNVRLAGYVHDFMRYSIQSRWREYSQGKGLNRYRLTDFAVGMIQGFRSQLKSRQEMKNEVKGSSALVRVQDPLLEDYFVNRYPQSVMIKTGKGRQDLQVRKDGKRVGKHLVILKGIMGEARDRGLRLHAGS
jgi:hypothetical protein